MTDRDEYERPSCPICTTRDDVQRNAGKWLCTHCWTVFSGSQDEWARTRELRDEYAARDNRRVP